MARAHIHTNRFDKDPTGVEGDGYASNGESQHSRMAAHGEGGPRRVPHEPQRRRLNGMMPVEEIIRRTQVAIGTLEAQVMFEQRLDPRSIKIAKLEKSLRIKRALLVELGRERNDPHYQRQQVRV